MKNKLFIIPLVSLLLFSSCSKGNPAVDNSKWGKEAAQKCYDTVGTVIPYFESDGFEYQVTVDDYGDPAIWFYLYYDTQETAEKKLVDYAYRAYEEGRYVCEVTTQRYMIPEEYSYIEVEVLFADKVLSESNAIEIQGIASQRSYNGELKGCLGLFCFNYFPNLDKTKFPNNAVNYLLGKEIPALSGNDLEYDFSFYIDNDNNKCLTIYVGGKGSSYLLEEEYFNALVSTNNYRIYQYNSYSEEISDKITEYPDYEDGMMYYAYEKYGEYIIVFYYSIYYSTFIIDIAKTA